MNTDSIAEVGIDEKGQLYIVPEKTKFPFIYREAMEVSWDSNQQRLYSPKPKEWSYAAWFKQICRATEEQSCRLLVVPETVFKNIPPEVIHEIQTSLSA